MTDGEMLEALWKRAKKEGLDEFFYFDDIPPNEQGLEGRFERDPHGTGPQVWIYRSPCPHERDKPILEGPEVPRELRVFAHEYGHFRSWLDEGKGTTQVWQDYFQGGTLFGNSPGDMSAPQKQLVMNEEERAWGIARDVLSEMGFSNWDEFMIHRELALGIYREKMGMTEPSERRR
jgi:hypothetical protein